MTSQPSAADRLRSALAQQLGLDIATFDSPGTSVCYRDDRGGTGQAAIYQVDRHTCVWADPALEGRLDGFASDTAAAGLQQVTDALLADDFEMLGGGLMRVRDEAAEQGLDAWVVEGEYSSTWLADSNPDHLASIAELASRCSEDDLEQADLEDLDEFAGDPIHGIVGPDGALAALAYGTQWDWDDGFVDVGVIVLSDHRRRGLGVRAIAGLGAKVLAGGATPLYRHEADNLGSAALATRLGFAEVLNLRVLRATDGG